jgi:hypothetical protein
VSGCDLQFSHGVDVGISFNYCSWTIRAPNDSALELWVRAIASVLPCKHVNDGLKNAKNGAALQRADSTIRVCATKTANFIESLLVPGTESDGQNK